MKKTPIETVYKGYRFRSRLEARWAVFFDTLGIPYQYEIEGFDLGSGIWYLPDFWLPDQKYWIEIKGSEPTEQERQKLGLLSATTHNNSFMMINDVWIDIPKYYFFSRRPSKRLQWFVNTAILGESLEDLRIAETLMVANSNYFWKPELDIILRKLDSINEKEAADVIRRSLLGTKFDDNPYGSYPITQGWVQCQVCNFYCFDVIEWNICMRCHYIDCLIVTSQILEAYTAARQARFEHK